MTEDDWDSVIRVHLKGTFAPTQARRPRTGGTLTKAGEDVSPAASSTPPRAPGSSATSARPTTRRPRPASPAFTQTVSLETGQARRHRELHRPGRRHPHGCARSPVPASRPRSPTSSPSGTAWTRRSSSPLVAWLASDKAGHVTGQVIRAVGERSCCLEGWTYGPTIDNGGVLGRHHARPAPRDGRVQDQGARTAIGLSGRGNEPEFRIDAAADG